jgi:urea transport system permease protein
MSLRLLVVATLVLGGLACLPLVADPWQVGQYARYLTYGLLAMSLALVWGQCGILSFGHAVFFGLGAYAMSLVTLGMVPRVPDSSWIGLAAGVLLPALLANLLGRFLFYGRGLRGAHVAVVMLCVAVIVERLFVNWPYVGGHNGLMGVPPLRLGAREIWDPLEAFWLTLGVVAVVYVLLQALVESRFGVVLRAIRGDEDRTALFGYDVTAYKVTVFSISGGIAGLAGALFVTQLNFTSPPLLGFLLSTEALIWVALGGRTLLIAAFLGAIAVRSLEALLAELLGAYWLLGLGGLLLLSVMLLPRGLIGEPLSRILDWRAGPRAIA